MQEAQILRPVKEGMISYTDLKSGEITLHDIAIMNDYLDVINYNEMIQYKD